jgi:hypothetical protein
LPGRRIGRKLFFPKPERFFSALAALADFNFLSQTFFPKSEQFFQLWQPLPGRRIGRKPRRSRRTR